MSEVCEVCGEQVRIIAFKGTGRCCGACTERRVSKVDERRVDQLVEQVEAVQARLHADWTP